MKQLPGVRSVTKQVAQWGPKLWRSDTHQKYLSDDSSSQRRL